MAGSTAVETTSFPHVTFPLVGREPGMTQLHVLWGIMELFRCRGSPGRRNMNWGNRSAHRNLEISCFAVSHPPLSQTIVQADGYRNEGVEISNWFLGG